MDKLAEQLKRDADRIEATVSDDLDYRIEASLRAVTPAQPDAPRPAGRPALFWWASTLTGVAAALAVIAIVNLQQPQTESIPDPRMVTTVPDNSAMPETPTVDWNAQSAMLTQPLVDELENLRSDLKKAEEKVKQDVGL